MAGAAVTAAEAVPAGAAPSPAPDGSSATQTAAEASAARRGGSLSVRRDGPAARVPFGAGRAGEAVVDLTAAAPGVDWATVGAESAVLSLAVDGQHVTDLVVTSADPGDREVALGPVGRGAHTLTVDFHEAASAPAATVVQLKRVTVDAAGPGDDDPAQRHAPVLIGRSIPVTSAEGPGTSYAGPLQNAVTDTPLVAWHELRPGATPGHQVIEYSVVWSNEDGGTSSPALMARWGRTTDIEWVYRVEVDEAGEIVPGTAVYQGPDHVTLPFAGTYDDGHPVLQTCTDNNLVCDVIDPASQQSGLRFVLVADDTRPADRAREFLMDQHPWTYQVMAAEMVREGRVEEPSDPATPAVGDQRTYLYVEVDRDTNPASQASQVGLALRVRLADGRTFRSDHGVAGWTITRDVPAATTVELPAGVTPADVVAIDAVRVPPTIDAGATVTVTSLGRAFLLDDSYLPQESFVSWAGAVTLSPASPAATLWSVTMG